MNVITNPFGVGYVYQEWDEVGVQVSISIYACTLGNNISYMLFLVFVTLMLEILEVMFTIIAKQYGFVIVPKVVNND